MGLVVGCRGEWTGDAERPGPCQCSFCSGERLSSPQNHDWKTEPQTEAPAAANEEEPDREPGTIFGIDRDLVRGAALAYLSLWATRKTKPKTLRQRLHGFLGRFRRRRTGD